MGRKTTAMTPPTGTDDGADFPWDRVREELGLAPGRDANIARVAIDRNAHGSGAARIALRGLGRDGEARDISYDELRRLTNRFARLLRRLGVRPGERVFGLAGRTPELLVAAMGAIKAGCVFSPLFQAFGPEPIRTRLTLGDARALITTEALFRRKVEPLLPGLPGLRHVLLADDQFGGQLEDLDDGDMDEITAPDQVALLHFTSGTTGRPKGALHLHRALASHYASARQALDLQPDDVFWCTADPGWVTGVSYGMVAPLAVGATVLLDENEFDGQRWCRVLQEQRVTVWYTAPTALRMMARLPPEVIAAHDFGALRLAASVGEPLAAATTTWGQEVLGTPIRDTWWQTETGAIMIAALPSLPLCPGAMGKPLPGIEAALVRRTPVGIEIFSEPEASGELALRTGWPSQFQGYEGDPERSKACLADGWYLSGDLARRDAEGYFHFLGRADDVIKSAGHLIGPFEVESVLSTHPAVAEVGVIGKPDPLVMEVVKAFVVPRPGYAPDETLRRDLMALARRKLGAAVAPREIEFRDSLPRTRSGKIMRRLLRARELGLPEGDVSSVID